MCGDTRFPIPALFAASCTAIHTHFDVMGLSATRTKAAVLARKRKDTILAAIVAMQAQKTKFFDTTLKERPELVLHKPRNGPAALLLPQ